jgi:hypothetical protein
MAGRTLDWRRYRAGLRTTGRSTGTRRALGHGVPRCKASWPMGEPVDLGDEQADRRAGTSAGSITATRTFAGCGLAPTRNRP